MTDVVIIIVYCIHCCRRQRLTATPHLMDQFNHKYDCDTRRFPSYRRQATFRPVPGKPYASWEDEQTHETKEYPYYEYGVHRDIAV